MTRSLRKRLLIDRLQFRLILVHLAYSALIVSVFGGVLFLPIVVELRSMTGFTARNLELSQIFLGFHEQFWPAASVLLVLMTAHWVLITHRIVGPLYRFRRVFDAVSHGDLAVRATIRKYDYLHSESARLESMVSSLRERIREIRDRQGESEHLLRTLEERVARGGTPEAQESLKRLQLSLETLRSGLEHFRLDAHDEAPSPAPPDAEVDQGSPRESGIATPA